MSMTHLIWKYRRIGLASAGFLFLSACASFGHKKIPGDRFNYNAAMVQSRNEQMLLNLVLGEFLIQAAIGV